jgi:hypothetical protein
MSTNITPVPRGCTTPFCRVDFREFFTESPASRAPMQIAASGQEPASVNVRTCLSADRWASSVLLSTSSRFRAARNMTRQRSMPRVGNVAPRFDWWSKPTDRSANTRLPRQSKVVSRYQARLASRDCDSFEVRCSSVNPKVHQKNARRFKGRPATAVRNACVTLTRANKNRRAPHTHRPEDVVV